MQNTDNLILKICNNVRTLVHDYSVLQGNNDILKNQVAKLRAKLEEKDIELKNKQEKINKIETELTSEKDVLSRETKLKIDKLVTMIDECIESLDRN